MDRRSKTLRAIALVAILGLTVGVLAAGGVVNINTAGEEQLTLLPRVGPALAKRIVEFREANGRFKTKEDLMLVRGIGETTFELIEPYITLEGATTLEEAVGSGGAGESAS